MIGTDSSKHVLFGVAIVGSNSILKETKQEIRSKIKLKEKTKEVYSKVILKEVTKPTLAAVKKSTKRLTKFHTVKKMFSIRGMLELFEVIYRIDLKLEMIWLPIVKRN